MEYFKRKKYQVRLIRRETYDKWAAENPKLAEKIDYQKFKRYWKYLRLEIYNTVLSNTAGLDLPLVMGNLSIKITDIDFKGEKDYLKILQTVDGEVKLSPFITVSNPKKATVVWKKSRAWRIIPSMLGFERAKTFKNEVGPYLRKNGINKFEKLARFEPVPSKHEEVQEKPFSIFDL